jgi:protocatechuate 3,4-dioxygenase alpha subunit
MHTSPYCTIGPFFPGDFVTGCEDLTSFQGQRAQGNALVEIWQPDANGVFRHPLDPRFHQADPGFFGWGRARTNLEGRYTFRTVMPGADAARCPHVNLMILAIGLTRRLVTTVFFAESPDAVRDPVLECVPDPAARTRMLARREKDGNGASGVPIYRYDIVTRGESETPFFVD